MSRRWLYAFAFLLQMIAFTVVMEGNYLLAPNALSLQLDALYVIFPGLYFPALPGLLLSALLALFIGATRPLASTSTLVIFIALWLFTLISRRRIRRDRWGHLVALAAFAQGFEIIIITLKVGRPETWTWGGYLARIGSDALWSLLAIALLAPIWVRFQVRFFQAFGWSLENEATHS